MDFNTLKKNLKKDFTTFKLYKIAVLGDSATQLYTQALRAYGYEYELNLSIYEADYEQIEMEIYDKASGVHQFNPDYIIIFQSTEKLLKSFYKLDYNGKKVYADGHIKKVKNMYETLAETLDAKIIYFNFAFIDDSVFGNYANKVDLSFSYQLRKINFELMNLAGECKNLFINDVDALQSRLGRENITESSIYINTDIIFSIDFLPAVAKNTLDIIQSISGIFKKCIILDLDNTLWGGVIGDDGLEHIQIGDLGIGKAFSEFQYWLKELKSRGIILAVCSKNTEEIAREAFEKHPDMVLSMDDFSIFVANWDNKADNIKYIQSILNIGFDSMVFIDDNPFEREMVSSNIENILIPDMPEDPAEYLNFLRSLNLFETASFSHEDSSRTEQYQQEAKRRKAQTVYSSDDDFLNSLEMTAHIEPFNSFNIPRVSQLTLRSNQFNLRTIRYTEDDIKKISESDEYINLTFSLHDKFGDYGLISVIILNKQDDALFIDTWIMSCRVLKRDIEKFATNELVRIARKEGFKRIIGEYIPTKKNIIVKNHYKDLGFTEKDNYWIINVDNYNNQKNYIIKKSD